MNKNSHVIIMIDDNTVKQLMSDSCLDYYLNTFYTQMINNNMFLISLHEYISNI